MEKKQGEIIFLGTGTSQGVPPIGCSHPVCISEDTRDKRFRSSALIKYADTNIVIDCGPDFRQQMLNANVKKLEGIFFTHEHNDHISGLDDIRPFYYINGGHPMPLYGSRVVLDSIKQRFAYFFYEKKYPGVPDVDLNLIDGAKINFMGLNILPIEVMHGNQQIFGFKLGDLVYITDASHINNASLDKINKCNILVLNALRKEPKHPSHFTLSEAIEISERIQPKKTYFTHISHLLGFHKEVESELPENIHLAYDGLKVNFNLT